MVAAKLPGASAATKPPATGGTPPAQPATPINGKLAGGSAYTRGGVYLVGEAGPELVRLPQGSRVYPSGQGPRGGVGGLDASETQRFLSGLFGSIAGDAANAEETGATLAGMLRAAAATDV